MDKYVLFVVVSGVLIFSIYFLYPALLPSATAIALFALLLSVITVFLNSLSVKMQVKLIHTRDLHKFINDWAEWHKKYYSETIEYMSKNVLPQWWTRENQYALDQFSRKPLYKDLVNNHLKYLQKQLKELNPRSDGDLNGLWKKYDYTVMRYRFDCKDFYDKITKLVKEHIKLLRGKEVEVTYNFEGKDSITPNFIGLVYSANILSEPSYPYYHDFKPSMIKCSANFGGKQGEYYQVLVNGNEVIANVNTEKTAKDFIQNFQFCCDILMDTMPSKKEKEELSKLHAEIRKDRFNISDDSYKVTQMLDALREYPAFQGDCSFVEV